jgi:multicomponent Na+:H+ antiporter subunit D
MDLMSILMHPGWVLMFGGVAAMLLTQRRARQAITVAAPVAALVLLTLTPHGIDLIRADVLTLKLVLFRADALSFIFALGFLLAATINAIYGLHGDDRIQDGAALVCAGAAVSAVFAGDLMTLFIFGQLAALASFLLILRSGTRASYAAAMRFLVIQIAAGVLLLNGAAYIYRATGGLSLEAFTSLGEPGALLIFIAFGIKAAFPLLHNWLQDAYAKAPVFGAVVLTAFTTGMAIYALARLFPGHDPLLWIGAVMIVFPVFFAMVENDLRRVLAYAMNSQLGFMVCAIGVGAAGTGSAMALNGAAAHAFASIVYTSLLFMSMGAVLYRTGTVQASELGGVYRSMPWTALFCIAGSLSLIAFPFFSGFVTISMTSSALAAEGAINPAIAAVWFALIFGMIGAILHTGLKVPLMAFFGPDRGIRVREAPFNMLLAMGMAAFFCLAIGLPALLPGLGYRWLYALLPFPVEAAAHNPFTPGNLVRHAQLLLLAAFAFVLLRRFGLYPQERAGIILDTDWLYRKAGLGLIVWGHAIWSKSGPALGQVAQRMAERLYFNIERTFSPHGLLAKGGLTGGMAIWTTVILGIVMLLSFVTGQG